MYRVAATRFKIQYSTCIACDDPLLRRSICPDHLVDFDVGVDADDNTDADNNIDIGLVFHSRVIGHRFKRQPGHTT